ncbi:hypothetical protein AAC387_Pa08g0629 [Persea americana]
MKGEEKDLSTVLAATVMIHDAIWSTVCRWEPSFPAEQTTVIPLARARSNEMSSFGIQQVGVIPPSERDNTSTQSCIDSSTALTTSAMVQAPDFPGRFQQALNMANRAQGAPPLVVPSPSPLKLTSCTKEPTPMEEVWVPCPFASLGDKYSMATVVFFSSSTPFANQWAVMSFMLQ